MAKRPDITTVSQGYYGRVALNQNFENLQEGFDNTLSLDGSAPNAMNADLDMNSNDILNASSVDTARLLINGDEVSASDLVLSALVITQEYATVAALLASTDTYTAGAYVHVVEGDHYYKAATSGDVTNAGGQQFEVLPGASGYNVKAFGAKGDGTTDDTAVFTAMASGLSNGDHIVFSAGTYILSSGITFSQNTLKLTMGYGAVIKQADNTQTLDTLLTFSGDDINLDGLSVNGNIANNSSYTGRGELVRITGSNAEITGFRANGVQDVDSACALFCYGDNPTIRDYISYNTGRISLRLGVFRALVDGIKVFDAYETNGSVAAKGIAHDIVPGDAGTPLKKITIRNYQFNSTDSGWLQAFVFDHDGVYGGDVLIDGLDVYVPNSDGVDFGKPVFLENFEVRNARYVHPAKSGFNCTMRIQRAVRNVLLHNVVFPGCINFDRQSSAWAGSTAYAAGDWVRNSGKAYLCTTAGTSASSGGPTGTGDGITDGTVTWENVEPKLTVSGNSVLCDELTPPAAAIEQFSGTLVVEDGVTLKNLSSAAIQTDSNYEPIRAAIGRLHLDGASGTPYLLKDSALEAGTSIYAMRTGAVTVGEPLSISGTFRDPDDNGGWVTGTDKSDAGVSRGTGRKFLAGGGDMPPRRLEKVRRSDFFAERTPSASDSPYGYVCVSGGAACTDAHADTTAYTVGNWVHANNNVYVCVTAGTSGTGTAPSGTTDGQTDGTVTWDHVDALAVFKGVASVAS